MSAFFIVHMGGDTMAKKKKKKAKVKREYSTSSALNNHHLCWPRKRWDSGYARALRTHWYFNVMIPADTLHRDIHTEMSGIPVPDGHAAKIAYEQVVLLEERGALHPKASVETRLSLLIALFDGFVQPTADGFKKQLRIVRRHKASE